MGETAAEPGLRFEAGDLWYGETRLLAGVPENVSARAEGVSGGVLLHCAASEDSARHVFPLGEPFCSVVRSRCCQSFLHSPDRAAS